MITHLIYPEKEACMHALLTVLVRFVFYQIGQGNSSVHHLSKTVTPAFLPTKRAHDATAPKLKSFTVLEHLQEFVIFYLAYLVFCQLLKRYAK